LQEIRVPIANTSFDICQQALKNFNTAIDGDRHICGAITDDRNEACLGIYLKVSITKFLYSAMNNVL